MLLEIKQRPVNESAEIAEINIAALPHDAVRAIVSGAPLLGQDPQTVLEFALSE